MMRDTHKHAADHDVVQEYAETLGGTQEERYSMLVAALKEAKAGGYAEVATRFSPASRLIWSVSALHLQVDLDEAACQQQDACYKLVPPLTA